MTTRAVSRGWTPGVVFLVAVLFVQHGAVVMFPTLSPAVKYPDGVALQFARYDGPGRAQQILDQWHRDERTALARKSVYYDYFFIACYTTAMVLACRWAAAEFAADGFRRTAAAGRLVVPAQLLAGASDATENVFLLLMLNTGATGNAYDTGACVCSSVKFGLLAVGYVYAAVAAARALARATARPAAADPGRVSPGES